MVTTICFGYRNAWILIRHKTFFLRRTENESEKTGSARNDLYLAQFVEPIAQAIIPDQKTQK